MTCTMNLISIRVLYGKDTFSNNFSYSLKNFIVKRGKIQLGFDNICPENNQRVLATLNMAEKTVQMSDFNSSWISYEVSIL